CAAVAVAPVRSVAGEGSPVGAAARLRTPTDALRRAPGEAVACRSTTGERDGWTRRSGRAPGPPGKREPRAGGAAGSRGPLGGGAGRGPDLLPGEWISGFADPPGAAPRSHARGHCAGAVRARGPAGARPVEDAAVLADGAGRAPRHDIPAPAAG